MEIHLSKSKHLLSVDDVKIRDIISYLYSMSLYKTFYDYFGHLSADICIKVKGLALTSENPYCEIFEELLQSIEDVLYIFDIDEVDNELQLLTFYKEIAGEVSGWSILYFIPMPRLKLTHFEVDNGYKITFHRFVAGKLFKASEAGVGIYLAISDTEYEGNYIELLRFVIRILKENEEKI